MAANQVSWGACAGPKQPPANGTVCVDTRSGVENWTCYDDDKIASDAYTCSSGQFCPLYKPRASSRCCSVKDATGCAAGHCVAKGKICCGNSNCDADSEECNEVAAGRGCCPKGRSCGAGCLTDPTWTCCGGKGCSSSGVCSQGVCTEPRSSSSAQISTSTTIAPVSTSAQTISLTTSTSLITAIPEAARTDPKSACFLSTQYTSLNPTPDWFKALPTSVQSSFATSSHATTPELCGISPQRSSGMSAGATAGIAIGAALGVILLALLALWKFRPGIWKKVFGGKKVNGVGEARFLEADMQHASTGELDGVGVAYKKSVVESSHESTGELDGRGFLDKKSAVESRHELGA